MFSQERLKNIKRTIKIIVVILAWGYVGYRISIIDDLSRLRDVFANITSKQIVYLVSILVLMPINWLIEAIKWRNLVLKLENLSIFQSLKAVWTGVAIGSLTPNRIGEFGGRILYLKKENRIQASGITLFGDLAQFIITFCIGLSSFLLILNIITISPEIKSIKLWVIALSIFALVISLIIYSRINSILNLLNRIKPLNKFANRFNTFNVSKRLKANTLIISLLRYIVFTTQFYFALQFFVIDISYIEAFISIASMYLAATVIPNIPFVELGIRLSFSLIFIGIFSSKTTEIMLSSTLIYIINVLFPVIIGGFSLLYYDKSH